jgi:VanZ family protein
MLIMLGIFVLSSRPSNGLPNFGWADAIVKKGGHMLGYAGLALAYWRALGWEPRRMLHALILALLYAGTDEFHQSFVVGRHASAADVVLFDGTGAALALWIRQSFSPPYSGETARR